LQGLIPDDGIYSLLNDNSGILWVGTSSHGVLKYDRNLSYFMPFKYSPDNTPSAKNIIRGIAEDKKETFFWLQMPAWIILIARAMQYKPINTI
jgi:ligand-binding sensor domain-containing protein